MAQIPKDYDQYLAEQEALELHICYAEDEVICQKCGTKFTHEEARTFSHRINQCIYCKK